MFVMAREQSKRYLGTVALFASVLAAPLAGEAIRVDLQQFERVRGRIETILAEDSAVSVAVAVAKDGKILWEDAFGWADREQRIAATPHTMYSLASISKTVTATGLMLLAQRGKVDLDRPANAYLGRGKITSFVGSPDEATVRRVLQHTAGLPLHYQFFWGIQPPGMDGSIARYGIVVQPPGEEFNYSNLGYGVLDEIVARVSGSSFTEFMRTDVFAPLGLTRIAIGPIPGLETETATRYTGGREPIPFYDFDHRGASAVFASAHDLVRFGMFHIGDLPARPQLLSESTRHEMQTDAVPAPGLSYGSWGPDVRYALGWIVHDPYGYLIVSHDGGMPGVSTSLITVPSEGVVAVALINSRGLAHGIADDLIGAVLPNYGTNLREARTRARETEPSPAFNAPAALRGKWVGEIETWSGTLPVTLVIQDDNDVHITLGDQLKTLVNGVRFVDGFVTGQFQGTIPTADAMRQPHQIALRVKLRGTTLSGTVTAQSAIASATGMVMTSAGGTSSWISVRR